MEPYHGPLVGGLDKVDSSSTVEAPYRPVVTSALPPRLNILGLRVS